jgi:hypothetical protein
MLWLIFEVMFHREGEREAKKAKTAKKAKRPPLFAFFAISSIERRLPRS